MIGESVVGEHPLDREPIGSEDSQRLRQGSSGSLLELTRFGGHPESTGRYVPWESSMPNSKPPYGAEFWTEAVRLAGAWVRIVEIHDLRDPRAPELPEAGCLHHSLLCRLRVSTLLRVRQSASLAYRARAAWPP